VATEVARRRGGPSSRSVGSGVVAIACLLTGLAFLSQLLFRVFDERREPGFAGFAVGNIAIEVVDWLRLARHIT
jgi:hypothetical protein